MPTVQSPVSPVFQSPEAQLSSAFLDSTPHRPQSTSAFSAAVSATPEEPPAPEESEERQRMQRFTRYVNSMDATPKQKARFLTYNFRDDEVSQAPSVSLENNARLTVSSFWFSIFT